MTPEQTAVARRLVESPHWRWVEGAKDAGGARCTKARSGSVKWAVDDWLSDWCELEGDEAPDLNDPATIGVIEHLACEAWGGHYLVAHCDEFDGWWLQGHGSSGGGMLLYSAGPHASRGEAWAAALLAAP